MYHKKEVQTAENKLETEAKFYQNFKDNCKALQILEKREQEDIIEAHSMHDGMSAISLGNKSSVFSVP
jgi:hypothetical protein